jgi:hypothetical protein
MLEDSKQRIRQAEVKCVLGFIGFYQEAGGFGVLTGVTISPST